MINKIVPFLSLFSSFSTLICCALPALFVSLGLGATLVSTLSAFPELIWFSEHKGIVFSLSGGMLFITHLMRAYSLKECPLDPQLARACKKGRAFSSVIFWLSLGIYFTGGFFAFVAPYFV